MNIQKGLSLASPFFRYFSTFLFLVSNLALPPELSVKKSVSLKPIPLCLAFAPCLWKTCSMVNNFFFVGYAANFRRLRLFCIYEANVRIFRELCKKIGKYFRKKSGQFFTFSVFHFWHLHFRRLSNDKLYYYILYIIYNNKNNNWIITTSLSIHPHPSPQPGKSSVFHNVDKVKCQKWKSEKLKKSRSHHVSTYFRPRQSEPYYRLARFLIFRILPSEPLMT